jgi:hypothetical protein
MSTEHTEPLPEPVEDMQECYRCGKLFSVAAQQIWLAPDAFNEEINDDHTPVWECEACREASAEDI